MAPAGDVVLGEGETTRHHECVRLYSSGARCDGTGTLLITNRRVVWIPEAASDGAAGFSLYYPSIAVHAVCRDTTDFAHACVYMQLDPDAGDLSELAAALATVDDSPAKRPRAAAAADVAAAEEESAEEEEAELAWRELRLVPELNDAAAASAALDAIYQALCECAALHPDAEADGEEEVEDGGEEYGGYIDPADLADATGEQLSMLERYDMLIGEQDGRFDDAEEDESEGGMQQ